MIKTSCKDLSELKPGDEVWIIDLGRKGIVKEKVKNLDHTLQKPKREKFEEIVLIVLSLKKNNNDDCEYPYDEENETKTDETSSDVPSQKKWKNQQTAR